MNKLTKKKKYSLARVYIVTRGLKREVYSNIKVMADKELLEYWKLYRALKRGNTYSEENLFIEAKPIQRSVRKTREVKTHNKIENDNENQGAH